MTSTAMGTTMAAMSHPGVPDEELLALWAPAPEAGALKALLLKPLHEHEAHGRDKKPVHNAPLSDATSNCMTLGLLLILGTRLQEE